MKVSRSAIHVAFARMLDDQIEPGAMFSHRDLIDDWADTGLRNDDLERVLEAPQARHPGKLRDVQYRGLGFQVPEFPRLGAARDVPTLPPAELGEHTMEVLLSAGVPAGEFDKLVASGAAAVAEPRSFEWAAVRE